MSDSKASPPIAIPMVDLRAQYAPLIPEMLTAIEFILRQGQFILGTNVAALESEIATFLGIGHAIGCASGTDALLLALRALEIGAGDEVIVPTFTFVAPAEAIMMTGATPVFVDVDENTFNAGVDSIAEAITPKTRAIIATHLYGLPADMPALRSLADRHGMSVIEDCAQAIGATIDGRAVGTFGDVGCFSFFPSKNLGGAGDGGMVVTGSATLAERIRALRNHGSRQRYYHDEYGYNSRLDELQAAILRVKLRHLPAYLQGRRHAASVYRRCLQGRGFPLPDDLPGVQHVYHQFTLRLRRRDHVRARLNSSGIACEIYYPLPLHRQAAFRHLQPRECPTADRLASEVLSLPMFPELTAPQIERISACVIDALDDERMHAD
jgi:dTDP-4-amino-4,6-dideoxygalactose transaminase